MKMPEKNSRRMLLAGTATGIKNKSWWNSINFDQTIQAKQENLQEIKTSWVSKPSFCKKLWFNFLRGIIISKTCKKNTSYGKTWGIVTKFCLFYWLNLSELISISPKIIRKPIVFSWFQGEEKLINSPKFAWY